MPHLTLYQCFFTLPSVRLGNVFSSLISYLSLHDGELLTFAISLQLLPASRMVFNLCSSAGVQGVLVLLFLAGGADVEDSAMVGVGSPKPPGSP